jgi:hypothetical protein
MYTADPQATAYSLHREQYKIWGQYLELELQRLRCKILQRHT